MAVDHNLEKVKEALEEVKEVHRDQVPAPAPAPAPKPSRLDVLGSFLGRIVNFTIDDARALLAFVIVVAFSIMYYTAMPDANLMGQVIKDWGFIVGVIVSFYFAGKFIRDRSSQ